MAELINEKELAEKMQAKTTEKIRKLKDNDIHPRLVVLLVGKNPAGQIYVRNRERVAKRIGVRSLVERYPETISEGELLAEIEKYNQDPSFCDILVQLPLPKHIDEEKTPLAIHSEKDVDGFHPMNLGRLLAGKPDKIPCTPYGIMRVFEAYSIGPAGEQAVVTGQGNIVGKPMTQLLSMADATVTIAHSKTENLVKPAQEADILVVAIGRGYFVTKKFVKPGAVVMDVGMNRDANDRLIDDVKFNEVEPVAGWITPVPKGVGPVTITMLMYQTIKSAKAFGAGEQAARGYLAITALARYLERKFDADPYLKRVHLTGEISDFHLRASAHQYFSLKDDHTKISTIMLKGAFQKSRFQPKEGMKVLVVGRVSLYEAGGYCQVYAKHMESDGIDVLYQELEERKEKLMKEGPFQGSKKMLPRFPKQIAVLTSPSGTVIRDIITAVKRRYPITQLVLFPTVVQGDQTADDVVRNIQRAEEMGSFDTMIIGHGGGSIEDLQPFNEERIARTIYQTDTPVIPSVGRETDTTIADLIADIRAATPAAAAELTVPILSEELMHIQEQQARLQQALVRQIQCKQERFRHARRSYVFRQPERLCEGQTIKLDRLRRRLYRATQQIYRAKGKQTIALGHQLEQIAPLYRAKAARQETAYLERRLEEEIQQYMKQQQQRFAQTVQSLDLLSPLKIMERGYSYTTLDDQVVESVTEIHQGDLLTIHYQDGTVKRQVQEIDRGE